MGTITGNPNFSQGLQISGTSYALNRWQTQFHTSGDVTTATPFLAFSSLTAGKIYRYSWACVVVRGGADTAVSLDVYQNAVKIYSQWATSTGSNTNSSAISGTLIFKAAGTSCYLQLGSIGTGTKLDGSSGDRNWASIELLNDYEDTEATDLD